MMQEDSYILVKCMENQIISVWDHWSSILQIEEALKTRVKLDKHCALQLKTFLKYYDLDSCCNKMYKRENRETGTQRTDPFSGRVKLKKKKIWQQKPDKLFQFTFVDFLYIIIFLLRTQKIYLPILYGWFIVFGINYRIQSSVI